MKKLAWLVLALFAALGLGAVGGADGANPTRLVNQFDNGNGTSSPYAIVLNLGADGATAVSASNPLPVSGGTADPCASPGVAKSSVAIAITSATTTSLVAVSGTKAVYVCGFALTISEVVTTANTFALEYGTGATCTSPTALTGTFGTGGITAGVPLVVSYSGGGATVATAPASSGICALTTIGASGSFEGVLTYVQQ